MSTTRLKQQIGEKLESAGFIRTGPGTFTAPNLTVEFPGVARASALPDRYAEAASLVVSNKKASASWLQRQLGVGYNAASQIIEQLERDGIVSAAGGIEGRTILKDEVAVGQIIAGHDFREAEDPTPSAQIDIPVDLPRANRASDDRLRLLIERVERLEEEKKGMADDIKDVYAEAKAVGYDVKIMRQVVKLRKMQPDARREQELLLETYKTALGIE